MPLVLIFVFLLGYCAIAFEHHLKVSKTALALITGMLCWTVYAVFCPTPGLVISDLHNHLSSIAEIILFIVASMTLVEVINSHNGFDFLVKAITSKSKRVLLWQITWISFFLSAVLDNLTTTIVMVSVVQLLIPEKQDRWTMCGMIVIAANAGGTWSPIGDVTSTMLWIGGQLSSLNMMKSLFIPSVVCLLVPLTIQTFFYSGPLSVSSYNLPRGPEPHSRLIFCLVLGILFFVPIFKTFTHLPPYIGILLGLGFLWLVVDYLHGNQKNRAHLGITHSLSRIDMSGVLFFLGILLSVSALESGHVLAKVAIWLDSVIPSPVYLASVLGVLSSVMDNVPLVAATMGMYPLSQFPIDHPLWEMIALASGTGGSLLIVGSAAGIVAMGMEGVDFIWYFKRMTLLALSGFVSAMLVYVGLVHFVF